VVGKVWCGLVGKGKHWAAGVCVVCVCAFERLPPQAAITVGLRHKVRIMLDKAVYGVCSSLGLWRGGQQLQSRRRVASHAHAARSRTQGGQRPPTATAALWTPPDPGKEQRVG